MFQMNVKCSNAHSYNYLLSQSHVAVQACRHDQTDLLKIKLSIRIGKKDDLRNFKCGMLLVPDGLV